MVASRRVYDLEAVPRIRRRDRHPRLANARRVKHRRQRGRSQPAVLITEQVGTIPPNAAHATLQLRHCLALAGQDVALLGDTRAEGADGIRVSSVSSGDTARDDVAPQRSTCAVRRLSTG
ncbi:hypothetical protein D9M71_596790 [compost metagenome]